VDWYPIYKRLYRNKTLFDPLVAYITATNIFSRSLESLAIHVGPTLTSRGDCAFVTSSQHLFFTFRNFSLSPFSWGFNSL
jgi:hypothetical protein